jgi:YbgC/YbaW family acyl-CoA thioester hydrolase
MSDVRYPMSDVPGSPRPAEMRVRRRVLFAETDTAGIVHFSNYFRYFEDAEHALWREAGLSIHPPDSAIGWPRISATCDFRRPLKFEQEFDISVRITEMTKRTVAYGGEITSGGERVAIANWKIACVSKLPDGSMRSADIPAAVAERLKPFVIPTSSAQPPASA